MTTPRSHADDAHDSATEVARLKEHLKALERTLAAHQREINDIENLLLDVGLGLKALVGRFEEWNGGEFIG